MTTVKTTPVRMMQFVRTDLTRTRVYVPLDTREIIVQKVLIYFEFLVDSTYSVNPTNMVNFTEAVLKD